MENNSLNMVAEESSLKNLFVKVWAVFKKAIKQDIIIWGEQQQGAPVARLEGTRARRVITSQRHQLCGESSSIGHVAFGTGRKEPGDLIPSFTSCLLFPANAP